MTSRYFFLNSRKAHLISLLKDMRYLRVWHYVGFGILGAFLKPANFIPPKLNLDLTTDIFIAFFSLIFAILFSIITNNIFDAEIDRISNPGRPLVKGVIEKNDYINYGIFFLFLSLIFSMMVSLTLFTLIFLFIGAYYIYSCPPFRFKKIPIFSKWIIGLNSLILLNIGRTLIYPHQFLPIIPSLLLIIGIGLIANFIDLKDIEGDKAGKIATLPNIIGEKNSKRLIGLFFIIIYPSTIILLSPYLPEWFLLKILLPIMILLAFIQNLFINKKEYDEIPVFLLNNFLILFIACNIFKFQ